TSIGANVPSARNVVTGVWTGSEMIVWGCYDNTLAYLNTGGRYNPALDGWTPTSTGANVPSARCTGSVVWTGSDMIVWSGAGLGVGNTGGRYNPSTDSWRATSTGANVPSARSGNTAVWTGAEMIVWGGLGGLNNGGRYDPAADRWYPISMGPNLPVGRQEAEAVWTGSEMIVWGGSYRNGSYAQAVNSGG